MFCYQCEQTAGGSCCTKRGVCGKDDTTAILQDVLVHVAKGVAQYAHGAAQRGARDPAVDVFVIQALFTTVTNVDFDPARLEQWIRKGVSVRSQAKATYEGAGGTDAFQGPATFVPADTLNGLVEQGRTLSIAKRQEGAGEDVTGLQELILYGLKGAASYADHAHLLDQEDPELYAQFHAVLAFLCEEQPTVDELLTHALKVGEINLKAMEILDTANTETYGHPEPTAVPITAKAGKAILVSGHDLRDLALLLEQTADQNINIYTHGEMLPCHGYPALKKHPHFAGNYGGAWQDQHKEFDAFPGAILMTTNCLQKPKESYQDRIFTTGLVAWPGVTHIGEDKDFTPVIKAAQAAPGFAADEPEKTITVGFGRNAVLGVADKVIEAVKAGVVKHFFLVGGCDGAKPGRNYYTEFAEKVPDDCVILTLACGKYRFNKLDFGDIGGIPRLLDIGQCNDAYSAIQIAMALAQAFDCGVNDLPLSLVLSWYEQKAVAILLTLLHLGVKNIRLGPSLPAFVTPTVLQVLVDKFVITPIGSPEEDLRAILG